MRLLAISDIHLFRKTDRLRCALMAADHPDALLIAGDLADRAEAGQFTLLRTCIRECLGNVPVYAVMGNHDIPVRDDTAFRAFESSINAEKQYELDVSGAFYHSFSSELDIAGLNPLYHQKMFFFTDKGKQLLFLEEKLRASSAAYRIVLCHPPLLAHNPQRCATPYIAKEQDAGLQQILDGSTNVIFLSGHTHMAPVVEIDQTRNNIYINNGSICPTTTGNAQAPIQQGNITILSTDERGIHICIKGIHTSKEFYSEYFQRSNAAAQH